LEEEEGEEQVGWRTRAPGLSRGLAFDDASAMEGEGDWVIEAFLGRGKGDEVRKPQETLDAGVSRQLRTGADRGGHTLTRQFLLPSAFSLESCGTTPGRPSW
jgi:hypothetical protein